MSTHQQDGVAATPALDPVRVYEPAALEEHLAALVAERERLRSLITAAEARRDQLAGDRPPSVSDHLGTVMLDTQAQLAAEWEACRRIEAAIEEAAESAAAGIVADARSHANALRTIAGEISASRAEAAHDEGEQWWQDVIDLTRTDSAEPARIA
ncbi:MAG: hypothetical protein ACOYXM_11355 [Actinomycetota bacterium]